MAGSRRVGGRSEARAGERPGALGHAFLRRYRRANLARYRFHTGATLRPIADDEVCPILFRDLGLDGTGLFLGRSLRRLAGPPSPITYMRTWDYREPYVDHGRIGRLVFLRPLTLYPWHSGVEHIYVADGAALGDSDSIGYVPGHIGLREAASLLAGVTSAAELRDAFGPEYDDAWRDGLERVTALQDEQRATERGFEPLRRRLQSRVSDVRVRARDEMRERGLAESDLCTAWHHLPDERRQELRAIAEELAGEATCRGR